MPNILDAFVPISTVLGDISMFDPRSPNFRIERLLNAFLFILFIWNSISFSPLVSMFMLQCCNLQLLWILYRWPKPPKKAASDDLISKLSKWKYKGASAGTEKKGTLVPTYEVECCICLAKYTENEEIRQLPCSHLFHLLCVDKWLKVRSICPICNQDLEKKKIN